MHPSDPPPRSSHPPPLTSALEDDYEPAPRVLSRHREPITEAAAHSPFRGIALLGVHADEFARTGVLGLYLFLASSIFVLGRTTRDAIFLSTYGARAARWLPLMFIAYGLASATFSVLYSRIADRIPRDRLVLASTAVGAALYLGVRGVLPFNTTWLPAVFYVASEIVGALVVVQFWSIANDLHDARSARRLFSIIGLGRTLGLLASGLGASTAVQEIGTNNLIFVLVALMAAVMGLVRWLSLRYELGQSAAPAAPARPDADVIPEGFRPYVRVLGVMILLGFVAVNVGDFQFKAAARLAHPDRDGLTRFMSLYYATLGAVALPIQLFVTPRLLRRFGVLGGLLALPTGYLLANLLLLAAPTIQTATILKISDNALQFTVFDATQQLLYFPLPQEVRGRARAWLETLVKPLGYALAGCAVLLLRAAREPDSLHAVAWQSAAVVPMVLAWIAVTPRVHDRYLDALRRSIARRDPSALAPPEHDASTRAVLERTLQDDPNPKAVVYALDQLVALDPAAARVALGPLLDASDGTVRANALATVGRLDAGEHAEALRRHLDDDHERCAIAAVQALACIDREDSIAELTPVTLSPRQSVRDAALGALLAHGGIEGALIAWTTVEAWLRSDDAAERRRAASLLAFPGVSGVSRVVRRLLRDPDPGVRRAALRAAGASRDPRALEPVLDALDDPTCEKSAVRALGALGEVAVPAIAKALGSPATRRSARLALPRALQLVGTRAAYEALLSVADEDDEWVRQKILASASRLRGRMHFAPMNRRRAVALMEREIADHRTLQTRYAALRSRLAMPLVDAWAFDRLRKSLVRFMRIAELSLPHARAAAARDQLFSLDPSKRAAALELSENLLSANLATEFAARVDALYAMRASPLPGVSAERVPEAAEFAQGLLASPDAFTRVIGLDIVQFRGTDVPFVLVFALMRDAAAEVREMATLTLAMRRPRGWLEAVNALVNDPDPDVQRYARYVASTGRTGMEDDEMFTTLEKLLYLQRVPLFAEVPPEHLLALAKGATVERRGAGDVVFTDGDAGDALYFVIEGTVRVSTRGRPDAVFSEGEVFGEMSLLDSAPRTATATVPESATLMRIEQGDFYDVLHGTSELAEGVIRVLVRRLRAETHGG